MAVGPGPRLTLRTCRTGVRYAVGRRPVAAALPLRRRRPRMRRRTMARRRTPRESRPTSPAPQTQQRFDGLCSRLNMDEAARAGHRRIPEHERATLSAPGKGDQRFSGPSGPAPPRGMRPFSPAPGAPQGSSPGQPSSPGPRPGAEGSPFLPTFVLETWLLKSP